MLRIHAKDASPSNVDNIEQILYCKCGKSHTFKGKVARSVVLYTPKTFDTGNGLLSISCPYCNRSYPKCELPHLLKPNEGRLVKVNYVPSSHVNCDGHTIHLLSRERNYAFYDKMAKKLFFYQAFDYIEFNEVTKFSIVYFDNTQWKDEDYLVSASVNDIDKSSITTSNLLDITNLIYINYFFGHTENVKYTGLKEAFSFFKNLEHHIWDIKKIKKIAFVTEMYNSNELIIENTINPLTNEEEEKLYKMEEDEFDGSGMVKLPVEVSVYMESISEIGRLFFAIMSFSNITTILLTKGYIFLDEYLKSKLICNSNVYKTRQATNPSKIMEISTNFTKTGGKKNFNKFNVNDDYLKISNIIFQNIRRPQDVDILYKIYNTKILSKKNIESLFQNFNRDDLYAAFGVFCQPMGNAKLTYKHFKHVLTHKLYVNFPSAKFWEIFIDTINTINQIVISQNIVREYVSSNKKTLSKADMASYKEYLSIKSDDIFEAKTQSKLTKMHDDFSALHAVFQDQSKNALYMEAIKDMDKLLNRNIDDIKFTLIPTAKDVHKEHVTMSHCIHTYISYVIENKYLIINVKDETSNELATMTIIKKDNFSIKQFNSKSEDTVFTFNQLKGYQNSRPTKYMIDKVKEYLKITKVESTSSSDLTPSESHIKKRPEYLSDEDTKRIREQKLNSVITDSNSPLKSDDIASIFKKFKEKIK